ncbi:hypothetical protein, partial [Capnocytophaga granulosa]
FLNELSRFVCGCKGTTFFVIDQIFFQKFFLGLFFSLAIFAGAKVQPFFQLTKSFFKNFSVSF